MILAKQAPKEFLSEASTWLKDYQRLKPTDGYQGIALETAKARFALAREETESEKTKRLGELLKFVADMTRVRSPYQSELVLLRLEILKACGREKSEATTYDEALALADAAAAGQQWDEALAKYNAALQLADKQDESRTDSVRQAIAKVQYMLARDLYGKGKVDECLKLATSIRARRPTRRPPLKRRHWRCGPR